jgi:hypothetical protein
VATYLSTPPLHLTCANDSLPPTGEWVGGVFSPPVKRIHSVPAPAIRTGTASTVDHARHSGRRLKIFAGRSDFRSQRVLPGQFLDTRELVSLTFLSEFKGVLASRIQLLLPASLLPGPASIPEDLLCCLVTSLYARMAHIHHCRLCLIVRTWYWSNPSVFNAPDWPAKRHNVSALRLKACKSPPDVASCSFSFQNRKMSAGARSGE